MAGLSHAGSFGVDPKILDSESFAMVFRIMSSHGVTNGVTNGATNGVTNGATKRTEIRHRIEYPPFPLLSSSPEKTRAIL